MNYPEIRTMGENAPELEFQPWSESQKEVFISGKLAQYKGGISETGYKELDIKLLHSERLVWERDYHSNLPPYHGKIIGITPDVAGGRKKLKFVSVDFAGSSNVTGITIAQFGLGAVEITVGGDIVIDCAKLERPKGAGQLMFPQNTFVERAVNQSTSRHK